MVKLLWNLLIFNFHILPRMCVKTKIECGYKQCPLTRDGALNVHLIPHSHMDAGWVKTFDEYYYGKFHRQRAHPHLVEAWRSHTVRFTRSFLPHTCKMWNELPSDVFPLGFNMGQFKKKVKGFLTARATVSTANVQLIFHSVLSELLHDKRRKFTFSETAYFWRWWKEQRPNTRATFRTLVQEGRAEFAGGGWTHADSATVGYLQVLDMWTWGLRKLNDTLGPCGKPKAAWQIDTYGHTREQASLLAQMGFDGLFLGRVYYTEREAMMEEDRMEFMWRGSDVLGKMSDIMTHTLFNLYNAPEGFCFDFLCGDEPLVDDPDTKLYNADKRVNDFIAHIERQAKYYDHDNILVTMGGDFTYQSAANWFMNMDKLINHVNTHPANISDINIFYSTPSCYLKAIYLYGRRDKAIYTERGDHLPYASDASTYWTGFYTSRPSFKYLVKKAHVFLQIVKQLTVIAQSGDSYELHLLRHAVGLVLHHDAVTGTSQQHVTNDFVRIISEAMDYCTKKASHLLSYMTPTWGASRRTKNSQQFIMCHQLNMSQCRFTESQESILLLVYNPLSVKTYHHVRLPAIALHYSIRDYNDEEVEYQLVPLPASVINLPGRVSTAIQELWFEAENIPALGYTAYYISPIRDQLEENEFAKKTKTDKNEAELELIPSISNEYLKVTVDRTTGLLESIQHVEGVKIQVSQNFYAYVQGQHGLQSGAYSFRPDKHRPAPITDKVQYNTVRGSLIKEIRQRFSDWITQGCSVFENLNNFFQIIRLYRGEEFIELEWIVGPVPIGTDLGKEVVSIFSTNISNNGDFYTDSNGRQMMKRSCWNESAGLQSKKPVPSCYFPVTSRICISSLNSSSEMCVLTDRTQGGTSYNEGEIELMVHRRLLTDDGFGLEETLNEEAYGIGLVVKGKHRLIFGNYKQDVDDITFSERVSFAARRWELEPWYFFTSGEKLNRRKWQNVRNKRLSALKLHGLPRHIHILTLEPWKAGSVLLRLENTLEKSDRGRFRLDADGAEDPKSHITVELRKIFIQLRIKLVRETTLAANQWLDDARQMDWSTRYVYNGGDDGILAEDHVEDDPTTRTDKDSRNYSDEESDYARKRSKLTDKILPKHKNKNQKPELARKKRSLNDSLNIDENIINPSDLKSVLKLNNTEIPLNTTVTTQKYQETSIKSRRVPKKTQKLSFWNRPRQKAPDRDVGDEVRSSEEDFSSNLKKRSPRKKKGRSKKIKDEIIYDNSDDGITKSIYEMYYRKPPSHQSPASKRKKNRRIENEYEEITETSRRKRKKKRFSADMPFFMTDRRLVIDNIDVDEKHNEGSPKKVIKRQGVMRKHGDEDYDDEDDDNDEASFEDKRRRPRNRWKRMSPKEEPMEPNNASAESTEPDYVVTLRPTQIRTFIIWFENNKKTYTL